MVCLQRDKLEEYSTVSHSLQERSQFWRMVKTIYTLYARNLNEKVSLNKLKNGLKNMFVDAGFSVLDIQACKNLALRGQAFISFKRDVNLEQVIDSLNTKILFDKPVVLEIAKQNSDIAVKKLSSQTTYDKYLKQAKLERLDKRQKGSTDRKRKRGESDDTETYDKRNTGVKKPKVAVNTVPNKMMIITDLSDNVTQQDLIKLLNNYDGFLTVNYVAVRHLALIEFESEQDAIKCYKNLGSTVIIKDKASLLMYAKK